MTGTLRDPRQPPGNRGFGIYQRPSGPCQLQPRPVQDVGRSGAGRRLMGCNYRKVIKASVSLLIGKAPAARVGEGAEGPGSLLLAQSVPVWAPRCQFWGGEGRAEPEPGQQSWRETQEGGESCPCPLSPPLCACARVTLQVTRTAVTSAGQPQRCRESLGYSQLQQGKLSHGNGQQAGAASRSRRRKRRRREPGIDPVLPPGGRARCR